MDQASFVLGVLNLILLHSTLVKVVRFALLVIIALKVSKLNAKLAHISLIWVNLIANRALLENIVTLKACPSLLIALQDNIALNLILLYLVFHAQQEHIVHF